jgi:hypothetical protein
VFTVVELTCKKNVLQTLYLPTMQIISTKTTTHIASAIILAGGIILTFLGVMLRINKKHLLYLLVFLHKVKVN